MSRPALEKMQISTSVGLGHIQSSVILLRFWDCNSEVKLKSKQALVKEESALKRILRETCLKSGLSVSTSSIC